MPISLEQLENVAFPTESWPDDLPMPGEDNIARADIGGTNELYRYTAATGAGQFAMEVVIDKATVPDPAEGVSFMLNQFAYLWRTDKEKVAVAADGSCRRINF